MAIKYTWKIKSLKKSSDPSGQLDGVIVQTFWQCIGTDTDGNSGTFDGATPFDPSGIDPANFTAYEDLTEANVLEWIQNEVYRQPGYKAHIEGQIQKQIDMIAKPVADVEDADLPWATSTVKK